MQLWVEMKEGSASAMSAKPQDEFNEPYVEVISKVPAE